MNDGLPRSHINRYDPRENEMECGSSLLLCFPFTSPCFAMVSRTTDALNNFHERNFLKMRFVMKDIFFLSASLIN